MRLGPKNLVLSFVGKNFTHFGGVYLLFLFFKKLKLKTLHYNETRFTQRNNHFTISESILSLVYPIILGFGRIETTHLLKHNEDTFNIFRFAYISRSVDLAALSSENSATVVCRRFRRLHDKLLSSMMLKPYLPTRIISDM